MTKKSIALLLFLVGSCLSQQLKIDHVNPLVGTDSDVKFSHGNTYPAAAMPFGMTAWTPSTGQFDSGWIYQYRAGKINGLKATHQPSPWIGDYGDLSLMPLVGELKTQFEARGSTFSHDREISTPYYYAVDLLDSGIKLEVAPTMRCAIVRLTFPETGEPLLVIDAHHKGSAVRISPSQNLVMATSRSNHGGVPANFACYYYITFDQPFSSFGVWNEDASFNNRTEFEGDHVGAFLRFVENSTVICRIGTSFISVEQAKKNLADEIGGHSFASIQQSGKETWETELAKISISGATRDQMETFYTAFYRTLLFPRTFYEIDAGGRKIHYSPYNGQVLPGEMYADNGFWDTFRAVYPFFTLLFPERDAEIIRGWINAYREGGWFPKWTSPGYRDCMIGTHVESLIADAYFKGITDFDIETAYAAMVKDGTVKSDFGGCGRVGIEAYLQKGYVPSDLFGQATARTLEFAYDDFCIYKMAQALQRKDDEQFFFKQANNYQNVWYAEQGFMWGKLANGEWEPNFSSIRWGDPFTEGSAWHYSWSVLHDIRGLIQLMGGNQAFCDKLDDMLSAPPDFDFGHYGIEIHEMTEMKACQMGQYAHGNQPVHHVLYLYNYAGQPYKTQKWVRHAMNTLYKSGADGLCGDEDNGQMSAWYLFSALGMYPVCPGEPMYVIGSPLFPQVDLELPNGKTVQIIAESNDANHVYIQSANWQDQPLNTAWISHQQLSQGGVLRFKMASEPNSAWASSADAAPFSLSPRP